MKAADHDPRRRPAPALQPPPAVPSSSDSRLDTKPAPRPHGDPTPLEEPGYGHGV